MKLFVRFLIPTLVVCMFVIPTQGSDLGYEPGLHETARLQKAEQLLREVPRGMQQDIEARLMRMQSGAENERKRFCVQYLLFQLYRIAQQYETADTATTKTIDTGIVTNIIDGETVIVKTDTKEFSVQLLGIVVPEAHSPGFDHTSAYLEQNLLGKTVSMITFGGGQKNAAYIYRNNRLINLDLIEQGFVTTHAGDHLFAPLFEQAAKQYRI